MPSQAKSSQVCWDRFGDVLEYAYPNPDDPRLLEVHKKGFLEKVRGASVDEVLEWAKLFVVWRDRKLRSCPVLYDAEEGKVLVVSPNLRVFRSGYYSWIKDLDLPKLNYRLVTLTLFREIGHVRAWANINHWISACLNRVRVKLRRDYGVDMFYLWVVEVHKSGMPHVHILFGLPRFVPALTFQRLLKVFQDAWVDDEGRPLCAPQGVDIRYIGRDVQRVKDYVLKYLVKDHWKVWAVEVKDGVVRARLSTLLIWLFKVRLFGMSHKLKRPAKVSKGKLIFYGRVPLYSLYRRVGYNVPYDEFKKEFLRRGKLKFEGSYLPILVPSAFGSRAGVDVEDEDPYKELVESF
jgi:hypothetical protein